MINIVYIILIKTQSLKELSGEQQLRTVLGEFGLIFYNMTFCNTMQKLLKF